MLEKFISEKILSDYNSENWELPSSSITADVIRLAGKMGFIPTYSMNNLTRIEVAL